MIDRKKFLLYSLSPVLACSLLGGIGFASLQATATQTQSATSSQTTPTSRSSKRAARKAEKAEKAKQAAAANSTSSSTMHEAAPTTKNEQPKTMRKEPSGTASTASASDIANAKSKGLVWVNTESKVYHTGGKYYGNTKHGQFMTAADAQKAGYKASKR